MLNTMLSAAASRFKSCSWDGVKLALRNALLTAAFARLSARSLPLMPTCAGTCLNRTCMPLRLYCASTLPSSIHRSWFLNCLPERVHPSICHRSIQLLTPSTHSLLSLNTVTHRYSVGQSNALRRASIAAVNSARLLVCRPLRPVVMLNGEPSANQMPHPALRSPRFVTAEPSVYTWQSPCGTSLGAGHLVACLPRICHMPRRI